MKGQGRIDFFFVRLMRALRGDKTLQKYEGDANTNLNYQNAIASQATTQQNPSVMANHKIENRQF